MGGTWILTVGEGDGEPNARLGVEAIGPEAGGRADPHPAARMTTSSRPKPTVRISRYPPEAESQSPFRRTAEAAHVGRPRRLVDPLSWIRQLRATLTSRTGFPAPYPIRL